MKELKQINTKDKLSQNHMMLNMGPAHPSMHGVIKLVLELDGETVINCDAEIGYLHRAFEKESERGTWTQVFPYTDRLNYVSPLINNVGYALAVEKLFDVEVTERCKYIRVLASEISRVCDHLTCVGASAMELGAFTAFLYMLQAREYFYELTEDLSGGRITPNYVRIGGLAHDLPENFKEKALDNIDKVAELISDVDKLLTKNRIFFDRMRGTGYIPKDMAVNMGFTGPCLRAAGVSYDVRKDQPYLIYDKLDFEIPIGVNSDNYDRYLVRMEEIEQSLNIIEQVLEKMPDGPINIDDPKICFPPKSQVYGSIEGLMHQFKLVYEGHHPPEGEVYHAVEGGNGELGFYIVSDGTGSPYRVRVRPPCFFMMQAIPRMLQGEMIADIVPTFGSINMIAGELDR